MQQARPLIKVNADLPNPCEVTFRDKSFRMTEVRYFTRQMTTPFSLGGKHEV